jgi:hypothetical protein
VTEWNGAKSLAKTVSEEPEPPVNETDGSTTKAEAALNLKLAGTSYSTIAKTLGYSSAYRARAAVERILATAADSPEEREQMRVLFDRRYSRLLQSVMGKAVDPRDPEHLAYNARAMAILDRMSKLHGLDQPIQIEVSQTDSAIKAYVAQMAELAQAQQAAEEAEIIDEGEIIDPAEGH